MALISNIDNKTLNKYHDLNSKLWDHVDYDYRCSEKTIIPWLEDMRQKNILGNNIMDIGCGAKPISQNLQRLNKLVLVDIGTINIIDADVLSVCYDINELNETQNESTLMFKRKIKDFLGEEVINTIILSNILNYVNYKVVLNQLYQLIHPGSRLVILNRPFKGSYNFVSDYGVNCNIELINTLESANFVIEEMKFWTNPHELIEFNGFAPREINYFKTSMALFQVKYIGEKKYLIQPNAFYYENENYELIKKYNFSAGYKMDKSFVHNFISEILYKEFSHYEFKERCLSYFNWDKTGKIAQVFIDYFDYIVKNKIVPEVPRDLGGLCFDNDFDFDF